MDLIIQASYISDVLVDQLVMNSRGQLYADTAVLSCNQIQTFTAVNISPPSSPRSGSPAPRGDGSPILFPAEPSTAQPILLSEDTQIQNLVMDPEHASALFDLISKSDIYRRKFCRFWTRRGIRNISPLAKRDDPNMILKIKLHLPAVRTVDYFGCHISNKLLWEFIELEDALHWLSTLGGAFSNLGEHRQEFAVRAGENAMKQLAVAMKFGDKTVIAKCWLFVAMSSMQQGKYSTSATIIKRVFKQTKAKGMRELAGTAKIVTICRGIWARLVYEANKDQSSSVPMCEELEVEFKFQVSSEYTNIMLEKIGAQQIKTSRFTDVYIDRQGLQLLKKDHWLRFRDGKVELKCPVKNIHHLNSNSTYRELKDVRSINEELGIKLPNLSPADLEDLKPGDVLGKKAKNDNLENTPDATSEDKSDNDWMILLTLTTTRFLWPLLGWMNLL
ncbi:uncharacterized protein LOC111714423 isoform X2 [Eurytemora carolleeae]|uniref:uncharacterized protein LOC111714423 isoform X2 n=1 Tax=Eurytemora carolleeae TaxID=1294199 RepID=UPI000C77D5C9|nr:uncharacterized protein LOC111714423 isoform X2 [Eurytemora carolleeae]|eukprot:XP_023345295.1 uncharacterized protein LOC111714423 isoform X2 [Eurytemora affinis]